MSRLRLAVLGKGGAGKSTISGTLARLLARRDGPVLALDSDPMPGLSISLGLGAMDEAMLTEAAEQGDDRRWGLKRGIGPARAVARYAVEAPDRVHFIQFGKTDEQGLRSILPSVSAFAELARGLAQDRVMRHWSVIGDLSAGTRQIAYDWAPYADTYLVVVEPGWASALTARRLIGLAGTRRPGLIRVVANKVTTEEELAWLVEQVGMVPWAVIPRHSSVGEADRLGVALLDHAPGSPVITAVSSLLDGLIADRDDKA